MKKEGLFYPACLSVVLGWAAFFASYELLARDAELTIDRSRKILKAMLAFPGKLAGDKDKIEDIELLEHRRTLTVRALEEAESTTRLAAMASAAIAAAVGAVVFTISKPPRKAKAKGAETQGSS